MAIVPSSSTARTMWRRSLRRAKDDWLSGTLSYSGVGSGIVLALISLLYKGANLAGVLQSSLAILGYAAIAFAWMLVRAPYRVMGEDLATTSAELQTLRSQLGHPIVYAAGAYVNSVVPVDGQHTFHTANLFSFDEETRFIQSTHSPVTSREIEVLGSKRGQVLRVRLTTEGSRSITHLAMNIEALILKDGPHDERNEKRVTETMRIDRLEPGKDGYVFYVGNHAQETFVLGFGSEGVGLVDGLETKVRISQTDLIPRIVFPGEQPSPSAIPPPARHDPKIV